MSNIFTTVVDGSGIFAVPEDDAGLAAASVGFASLLGVVPGLTFDSVSAFVRDNDGGGARTLNCLISNARLSSQICPSSGNTQTLLANIKSALLLGTITDVSVQEANLVDQGSGGGTISLPGVENIWFVDKGSNTTVDGSVQNPFHNIQDALDVASDGDLVWVYPGIYTEQISAVRGVSIEGADQFSCVLQNTGVDPSTAPLADITTGEWRIKNMTVRATGGDGSIIHRFGNNAPLGIEHEFIDCKFDGGQFQETTHRSMTSVYFLRCRNSGDSNGFNMTGDLTAGRQMRIRFSEHIMDCSPVFDSTHGAGGTQIICFNATRPADVATTWTVEGDWTYACGASWVGGNAGGLRFGSTGSLSLYLSYIDGGVLFTGTPGSVEVVNCIFNVVPGGRGDMDVDAGGPSQVLVSRYEGNSQQNGLSGAIIIPSKERTVGGDQQDRYMSLQDALTSIIQHDTVVRLREDTLLPTQLVINTYRQKIEGDGGFTLRGAASSGNMIVSLRNNQHLEFENIELSGLLEINGDDVDLSLGHNVKMYGSISIESGDKDSQLTLDHARLEGTDVYPYPIIIRHADPFVLIEGNSFVIGEQGSGGYAAIRYEVDNKNVYIKWSTITHGSVGVVGEPFMRTFAGPAVNYSSHHNVYNMNPQASANFANAVLANAYDTYGPAAVY
jgi:hypothetical protein